MDSETRLKAILEAQAKSKAEADAKAKAAKDLAEIAKSQRESALSHWTPILEGLTQWLHGLNEQMRPNGRQLYLTLEPGSSSRIANLNIAYKILQTAGSHTTTQRINIVAENSGSVHAGMGSNARWVERNYNFPALSYSLDDLIGLVLDFLEHNPEVKN